MKAIILAAGYATRLLPLTKEMPQCLLEVNNKTILKRQIEIMKKAGIDDIIVITGHLSDKIERLEKELGIKTFFNPFYGVSGMALTLWVAKKELENGFLFLYSDILFDAEIINNLMKNKGDICLAIKKDGLREEAEKVVEMGGIIENVSKTDTKKENGEFIGLAKFSGIGAKQLIKELNNAAKISLNTNFIQLIDNLIGKGEVVTAHDIKDSQFIDIDFPKDLKKAREIFK